MRILMGALSIEEFLCLLESVVCRTMLKTTRTIRNMQVQTVATTTNVYGRCPDCCSVLLSVGFSVVLIVVTDMVTPREKTYLIIGKFTTPCVY